MDAIAAGLRSGINVLDTAINYRHQRSERNIGAVLGIWLNPGNCGAMKFWSAPRPAIFALTGICLPTRAATSSVSTLNPAFSIRKQWPAECTA
jgi:hypothetical protein